MKTFADELAALLNKYNKESASNTPDFILAEFIEASLSVWNQTCSRRDAWYGPKITENIDSSEWAKAVDEAPQGPIIARD